MIFKELSLPGSFCVEIEAAHDDRGFFARTWCEDEARQHGIGVRFVQSSFSHNVRRGTLRGLHYQRAPHAEAKLVRCIRGAVFDVLVDVRPDSPAFGRWEAIELSAQSLRAVFIPEGVAHGFITLKDETLISYDISAAYRPEAAAGIRWDDPDIGIQWPMTPAALNERDAKLPRLSKMRENVI